VHSCKVRPDASACRHARTSARYNIDKGISMRNDSWLKALGQEDRQCFNSFSSKRALRQICLGKNPEKNKHASVKGTSEFQTRHYLLFRKENAGSSTSRSLTLLLVTMMMFSRTATRVRRCPLPFTGARVLSKHYSAGGLSVVIRNNALLASFSPSSELRGRGGEEKDFHLPSSRQRDTTGHGVGRYFSSTTTSAEDSSAAVTKASPSSATAITSSDGVVGEPIDFDMAATIEGAESQIVTISLEYGQVLRAESGAC
jgi:hypothetical protein